MLFRSGPVQASPWRDPDRCDDATLLAAAGERNRCLWGWPSTSLFDPDLQPLNLDPGDLELMLALEAAPAGTALAALPLDMGAPERAERVRRLLGQRVLLAVR